MNPPAEQSRTLSLVFTDLTGSTALKSEQGDAAALRLIARHRERAQALAAETGGRVIKWMGDGCFLTFETPSAAVIFALRLQQSHAGEPDLPAVRLGIHMGEVTEIAGAAGPDIHGLAADLASRIESLAMPGQILMSSAAFDSARQRIGAGEFGGAVEWRAHGAYELKGIDGAVNICEAGIAGISPLAPPPGGEKAHRAVTPAEEETLGWRPAVGLSVPRRENWRLTQRLGEGGFGEVWLALQEKTKAKRVFKFCFEPERVRGLKREVVLFRLLKESLGHRDDIAQIVDWDFDRAPYFLESEYTEGGDLAHWAERAGGLASIPLQTRLEAIAQAAGALGAAHSAGVLHKDIKPGNILISEAPGAEKPRVSLTDFGIGLITDPGALAARGITAAGLTQTLIRSDQTSSGSGTRIYMAPELLEGKPATTLSDIYALGVLLFQIVAGDFGRALAPGWERSIEDPLLAEDIAACVDGNPERRLQSAAELAGRLRGLAARRAEREAARLAALNAERLREAAVKAKRRRRQFLAASAGGVALTIAAALFAVRENRRASEQSELRKEADAAKALAEENLLQARRAVDDFFTKVSSDRIANEPGLQELRKELLASALGYYKSFADHRGGDASLEAELAAAHLRVAEIHTALGDMDSSLDPLERGLEMIARLRDRKADLSAVPSFANGIYTGPRFNLVEAIPKDVERTTRLLRQAVATWEELSSEKPEVRGFKHDLAGFRFYLAAALRIRSWNEAIACFDRSIALLEELAAEYPAMPHYRAELARMESYGAHARAARNGPMAGLAGFERAKKILAQLAEEYPDAPYYEFELRQLLAYGYGIQRQHAKAAAEYDAIVRLYPASLDLRVARAAELRLAGRLEEALADCDFVLKRKPDNLAARRTRVLVCREMNNLAEFQKELALLTQSASPEAADWNDFAWELVTYPDPKFREGALAVTLVQKDLEHRPNDGNIWNTLGVAQFMAGDYPSAAGSFKKSMEYKSAGGAYDRIFLAMTEWKLGNQAEARAWRERAAEQDAAKLKSDPLLRKYHAEADELLGIPAAGK